MENSIELECTNKIFNVTFKGIKYEVHMNYTRDFGPGMIDDIFREDGVDYVFDVELMDFLNDNI